MGAYGVVQQLPLFSECVLAMFLLSLFTNRTVVVCDFKRRIKYGQVKKGPRDDEHNFEWRKITCDGFKSESGVKSRLCEWHLKRWF